MAQIPGEVPNPEAHRFDKYDLSVTTVEETGLRLFTLTDKVTGVSGTFAEFNPNFDVHAGVAWVGARTSRSSDPYPAIFKEINTAIKDGKYTAGDKLAGVFVGYGHASVADMAPVMLFFNNMPIHLPFRTFNEMSVGGGQELSTRYVNFEDLGVPEVGRVFGEFPDEQSEVEAQEKWEAIQTQMVGNYNKWFEKLQGPLASYLAENFDGEVKPSTLTTRSLDVARMWIPVGARTSQTMLCSVRQWVDMAGQLRVSGDTESERIGDLIIDLLSLDQHPACPDIQAHFSALTRHSEGSPTTKENVEALRDYLLDIPSFSSLRIGPAERVAASSVTEILSHQGSAFRHESQWTVFNYAKEAMPATSADDLFEAVASLTDDQLSEISHIIFRGHTQFDQMRAAGDSRGIVMQYESALAYIRDINRHRSFGRHVLSLELQDFDAILDGPWNKNHAIHNAVYWQEFAEEWERDWSVLYDQIDDLRDFLEAELGAQYNPQALINILPLGHQINMTLSAPASQWSYMTSLRIGLGGDFGYRADIWNMLEELRQYDPGFVGMARHLVKPDVNDVDQIVGRS